MVGKKEPVRVYQVVGYSDEIDNPMWCSYGRRPNNAYLIGQDGLVVLTQQWNDPVEMENAIQRLLDEKK